VEWIEVPDEGLKLRDIRRITKRDQAETAGIREQVEHIIAAVQEQGDTAVREMTQKFDGIWVENFLVSTDEINEAVAYVGENFIKILEEARDNIQQYHERQKQETWMDTFRDGVRLGAKYTPIQRVGVYVPGGTAAYPSTVLMDVIPAHVAGVPSIAVFTPPGKDGKVNPYILTAARIAGATEIYKIGGAQGIAAAAYGTETVSPVFKIVGPGNAYVAMAKQLVFGTVGIDMIAGPSEVGILADETSNPVWIAADLLAQAEHDRRAAVFLVTPNAALAGAVEAEIERQMEELPRKDIIADSIKNYGKIFITKDRKQAIDVMNLIAPEHLEIDFAEPESYVAHIINAGAIFIGAYTPEPVGDYFAGPNHTLPTMGTAAFSSPLGVYDFVKRSSVLEYNQQAFVQIADKVAQFADVEGLQAHGMAVRRRMK
jgi:histidinol dehydrogenase